jgi:prepilin-type N-terminal cleavage/methylation domain-containing protein
MIAGARRMTAGIARWPMERRSSIGCGMKPPGRGFTIVELVVGIVLLGIVLAVAASRFSEYRDRMAVQSAAADIGAALAYARQTAVTRRSPVTASLDSAGGRILLYTGGGQFGVRQLRTTYGVSLSGNRDSVTYDARGIGFGASNLTIVIRKGVAADSVVVSRLGRVRW